MKTGWETEKERLLRLMKIPAKRKLEWLREMNELKRHLPKSRQRLRRKLSELTR